MGEQNLMFTFEIRCRKVNVYESGDLIGRTNVRKTNRKSRKRKILGAVINIIPNNEGATPLL